MFFYGGSEVHGAPLYINNPVLLAVTDGLADAENGIEILNAADDQADAHGHHQCRGTAEGVKQKVEAKQGIQNAEDERQNPVAQPERCISTAV